MTKVCNGLTNALTLVSRDPCMLTGYAAYSPNAAVSYVQFFSPAPAGTLTLGTTAPDRIVILPITGGTTLTDLRQFFANGLVIAATTTATGSSAPASAVDVVIDVA